MTTALFTHPDCTRHAMPNHPERPERLIAVMERLRRSGLAHEMKMYEPREISREDLERVHPGDFVDRIEALEPREGVARVDPDTFMSPGSGRAARLAAGACLQAVEAVLNGDAGNAFCAVRPPGHHAEIAEAMGFCLYNNIAIAAARALRHPDIERVAILDFDVHHCNGTVDIFKDDERVLVCSSFQEHFYPHRYLDYTNPHIVNTPLEAGTTGRQFRRAIERDWLPALALHRPDLVLVSAGFDAHRDDPIGGFELTEADFRWVTRLVLDQAASHAGGRLVSTLEGGYDLEALADSAQAHVEVLLDYAF